MLAGNILAHLDGRPLTMFEYRADGATAWTRRLGPGDCFGLSLEGKAPTEPERVRACEDSTACFIKRGDLKCLAMVAALIEKRGQTGKQPEGG